MERVIYPTKPLIADLILGDNKLFVRNPRIFGREEAKNTEYIGETIFGFGGIVPYIVGEEKARLPNSNAILTIETVDVSSGEIFNEQNLLSHKPYDPIAIYLTKVKYYRISPEQVDEYFQKWGDYRRLRGEISFSLLS